ncbi:hypothetical protein EIN_429730 [Entamoeba invadens IP1]|uniref:TLDc domain-containing protein n=1 Tax=Entamoeba invadens IP1 TaxID=370355 RepID=A0A0A1UHE8_ENTIV|nr:hypothetical protein EIN_429730 [Entamoeba invadens IP1]ELP95197.1 hypothetical protein EIN_429730 [Entamoeba invadens IP1]|eukprot:XP_004261968.1 hypothetical protein EIN_429730 [Entamoeba invadens IP1]
MGNEQGKHHFQKGSLRDLVGKEDSCLYTDVYGSAELSSPITPRTPRVSEDPEDKEKTTKTQEPQIKSSKSPKLFFNKITPPKNTKADKNERIENNVFFSKKRFKSSLNLKEKSEEPKRMAITPRVEDEIQKSPRVKVHTSQQNENRMSLQSSDGESTLSNLSKRIIKRRATRDVTNLFEPKDTISYFLSQKKRVVQLLQTKFGLNKYSVLYDSTLDELSARSFNSKISCQQNIFIFAITKENAVFGCFQQSLIPPPPKFQSLRTKTENFYVFGFADEFSEPIIRNDIKDETGIVLYPNKENGFVFSCIGAFWIMQDWKLYIQQNVGGSFNADPTWKNPYLRIKIHKFLNLDSLVVLVWE